jgi:hypothetical protein
MILAGLMFRLVDVLGHTTLEGWLMATGVLVRLRPERAGVYPWVPAGVWLAAHRRQDDEGVLWLDAQPAGAGLAPLPVSERDLQVRPRDTWL